MMMMMMIRCTAAGGEEEEAAEEEEEGAGEKDAVRRPRVSTVIAARGAGSTTLARSPAREFLIRVFIQPTCSLNRCHAGGFLVLLVRPITRGDYPLSLPFFFFSSSKCVVLREVFFSSLEEML